ncbi:PODXL protein, partial [Balaeniceps rex]|nr:PODXL protein [Balaeniceps rex]
QGNTTTNSPGNLPSTLARSPATVPGTTPTNNTGNPPSTLAMSPATVPGTTPTNNTENPPSTLAMSPATVPGTIPTNNMGHPPPTPTTSSRLSQQVSSSASSGASTATLAATSGVAQQKTNPPAKVGSLAATTTASPVPTPLTTSGSLGTAVTSPSSVAAQGYQPLDQVSSTAASTGVPTSGLTPGLKDDGVSSPTSVTKQPPSCHSSPVQGLASSTRPGSISTSVTPFDGSVSATTSKASLSLPPGSINNVSEAATTLTLQADQRSHVTGSVPTKPASADQSPASAQPSAPAPEDQTASSSPGHQQPNAFFQNEIICIDQVQNNRPTMYLKEAKTCAEWRTSSVNVSFFESFCSTGQHAFNASRETCMVMLTSREPRSQHWAVRAVVHGEYDPTILPRGGQHGIGMGDPGMR